MTRMAFVIKVKPDMLDEYKHLHNNAWPEVLSKISECNIRNYSIFLREPENLLFSVFDYVGKDFTADTAKMAADPITKKWWALTDPCQEPLDSAEPKQWWAPMEQVFHHD